MKLPKKIENCPIIDAVVELRFSSSINENAVFGVIFNALKEDYPNVEPLPILQLPEPLRASDPGLQNKPHYRISGPSGSIQIGPGVFVVGAKMPYPGWTVFYQTMIKDFQLLFKLGIVDSVSRLGLRYINLFDRDIFKFLNLELKVNETKLSLTNTLIRTELEKEDFKSTLQISNNVSKLDGSSKSFESVIDVDTFKTFKRGEFLGSYEAYLEKAHEVEKSTFFQLLNEDFIKTLKPIY